MKKYSILVIVLLLASLFLAACGGQGEEANTGTGNTGGDTGANTGEDTGTGTQAEEVTLLVGHSISRSGNYEANSGKQFRGFDLWMEDVNNAGGVVLSDGTVVKFTSVSYDDESSSDRVQELYTRLSTEDNVDVLISPYSSGLTKSAGVIAEQYGKIMIAAGAASDSNMNLGFTRVYQLYTPSSRYLNGAVDLLKANAPDVTKVAFVFENDQFAIDVVNVASEYAKSLGYEVVLNEGYDSDTADFGPFINKIVESGAEAVLGGGHTTDGQTFARQFYEKGVDIGFFALLVAPPEPEFAELGDAALGIVGPSQWEPLAAFSEESAKSAGYSWIGPSSKDFTAEYEAAYDETPSYHAAGGYAAGLMLQQAIINADSTDLDAINTAMENLEVMTFYGYIKFDTSAEWHGLQIGHSMVYVQWQSDESGGLIKEMVWPAEGASASLLYPIP
ncbi:MAG: amino acid ABC transporter substrate-binding protein [Anaerolineales bacterium]